MRPITLTSSDRLTLDFDDYFDLSDVKDKSTLTFSAEISSKYEGKKSLGKIYDGPGQAFKKLSLVSKEKDLQVEFYFQKYINDGLLLALTKQGEAYLVELDPHGIPIKMQEEVPRLRLAFHDSTVSCNDAVIWGEDERSIVLVCQKYDNKSKQATVWVQNLNLDPFGLGNIVTNSFQDSDTGFKVDDFLNIITIETDKGERYLGLTKRYINSSPGSG